MSRFLGREQAGMGAAPLQGMDEGLDRGSPRAWGCVSRELAPSSVALLCRRAKRKQNCDISKADPNSVQAHGWMLSFFPAHSSPVAPGCPGGPGAICDTAGDNLHSLAPKMGIC